MNNNYFTSSLNEYSLPYNYSSEYSLLYPSTYFYSSLLQPPCPVHSPHTLYTPPTSSSSSSSMNISPLSYTFYQQQESQVVRSPYVQQQTNIHSDIDRTPLRRHQCFKKNELQILHQAFIHDPHPSTDDLQQLAVQLKVSIEKIRQWFKNRRHSDKQKKRAIRTTQTSTNI
ncbi:unnamed protein product [Rotaria sordida]|uniref:Homeobox domain-containing protein n=1 Tax=Rotaria sordida TaxID=392033 RepID=A0A819UU42_9BILA|nr:unnamed protein product [Rotaria sordida]CAF4086274.1 unnamed protein product [Rotaria sordida]